MSGTQPPIGSPFQPRSHGPVADLIQLSTDPVGAAEGRHDPGVLQRAVPMVEAMVALLITTGRRPRARRPGPWPGDRLSMACRWPRFGARSQPMLSWKLPRWSPPEPQRLGC